MLDQTGEIDFCLKHLRRGHKYDLQMHYTRKLKKRLNELDLSLEQVGTSDKEVRQFEINGYKISALDVINTLRCGPALPDLELTLLRNLMKVGNLTYEALGTTEAEILELAKVID